MIEIDLNQLDERELRAELNRRERVRKSGKCDFCGEYGYKPPCARPVRHAEATFFLQQALQHRERGNPGRGYTFAGPPGTVVPLNAIQQAAVDAYDADNPKTK